MGTAPTGIDHVALECFDLAGTERFYGEILGLPVVARASGASDGWEGRGWRLVAFGLASGAELDFFAVEGAERPESRGVLDGVAHVALAVRSRADLEAVRARLLAHGFEIPEEHDHGCGRHSIYCFDPNRHYVELTCPAER